MTRQTLYKWQNQLLGSEAILMGKKRHLTSFGGDRDGLRAEVKALDKRVHELQLEHDILVKANELIK
jgi:hypothetical protein